MRVTSAIYLVLNFGWSAILTGVAFEAQDWGFFLLESVWALVSAIGLYRMVRGRSEPRLA